MQDKTTYNSIESSSIRSQMRKILKSEVFKRSNLLQLFLEYIVEETLEGRSHQIKAFPIALSVFKRNTTFDPQTDPIVRIYAGKLRKALQEYYYTVGATDPYLIQVPKGSYVPKFSLKPTDKKSAVPVKKWHAKTSALFGLTYGVWTVFSMLVVFLVLLFTLNNSFKIDHTDIFGRTTMAIKPFRNISGIAENDLIAERITKNTEIAISQFSGMIVTSLSVEESEKMEKLKCDYILRGIIDQKANYIKVLVQIEEIKSRSIVFGKEYSQDLSATDVGYLEDKIANQLAVAVSDEFGALHSLRIRKARDNKDKNLRPHEALLLYYDYLTNLNPSTNKEVIDKLDIALSNHSNYAPAWAALSGLYMDRYMYFDGDTADLLQAKKAVRKAETINAHDAHVQEHLALVAYATKNVQEFYDAAEKQLDLNPNSTMMGQLGLYYILMGDYEKGLPLIEDVKKKNRYYPNYLHIGNYFYFLEKADWENTLKEANRVKMPELYWDPLLRAVALGHLERKDEAWVAIEELLQLKPNFETDGNSLMERSLFLKKHQDMVILGLSKVGFEVK